MSFRMLEDLESEMRRVQHMGAILQGFRWDGGLPVMELKSLFLILMLLWTILGGRVLV